MNHTHSHSHKHVHRQPPRSPKHHLHRHELSQRKLHQYLQHSSPLWTPPRHPTVHGKFSMESQILVVITTKIQWFGPLKEAAVHGITEIRLLEPLKFRGPPDYWHFVVEYIANSGPHHWSLVHGPLKVVVWRSTEFCAPLFETVVHKSCDPVWALKYKCLMTRCKMLMTLVSLFRTWEMLTDHVGRTQLQLVLNSFHCGHYVDGSVIAICTVHVRRLFGCVHKHDVKIGALLDVCNHIWCHPVSVIHQRWDRWTQRSENIFFCKRSNLSISSCLNRTEWIPSKWETARVWNLILREEHCTTADVLCRSGVLEEVIISVL